MLVVCDSVVYLEAHTMSPISVLIKQNGQRILAGGGYMLHVKQLELLWHSLPPKAFRKPQKISGE
jgi:hypothetical protein